MSIYVYTTYGSNDETWPSSVEYVVYTRKNINRETESPVQAGGVEDGVHYNVGTMPTEEAPSTGQ